MGFSRAAHYTQAKVNFFRPTTSDRVALKVTAGKYAKDIQTACKEVLTENTKKQVKK